MPEFIYYAKKDPQDMAQGVIHAQTLEDAIIKVIQLGLTPLDVVLKSESEKVIKKNNLCSSRKIHRSDVMMLTRQMADLSDASVPLLRCLEIVFGSIRNLKLKIVVESIFQEVKQGCSLSESLLKHPKVFSSFYIQMVKAGEQSAQLDKVLNHLARHLEKEAEFLNKIRSALAYPALILFVGTVTVFVLLTFVIPRLSIIFEDVEQALPLMTTLLLNLSRFLAYSWWMIIFIISVAIFYLRKFMSFPQGRETVDSLKIQIPFLGCFLKQIEVSRFCRHTGILIQSGIPLVQAVSSAQQATGNVVFGRHIKNAVIQIKNGVSLKTSLSQSSFFPEMAINMISIGEETGNQEQGFLKIADMYERQMDITAKTFVSLLGPIVLIVVVLLVGWAVVAMLLPILQMNLILQ